VLYAVHCFATCFVVPAFIGDEFLPSGTGVFILFFVVFEVFNIESQIGSILYFRKNRDIKKSKNT
jgi:hypothetical protein